MATALACCATAACASASVLRTNGSDAVSDVEYTVYSLVLDSLYESAPRSAYLVTDSTSGPLVFGLGREDIVLALLQQLEGLPPGLLAAYAARNDRAYPVESRRFRTRVPVRFLTSSQRKWLYEHDDTAGFPVDYPANGEVNFSRVGITPGGKYAVLHSVYDCGARCGEGTIVVLEEANGSWHIVRTERTIRF